MCGIVGYVGPKDPVKVLLEGLKKLEYRGYDSAGVAVVDEQGTVDVRRAPGKLCDQLRQVARHVFLEMLPLGQGKAGHLRRPHQGVESQRAGRDRQCHGKRQETVAARLHRPRLLRLGCIGRQQAAQQAHYLGSNARTGMNQLLGFSRNPPDIQYHHLVNQIGVNVARFGQRAINSLANVVPTPAHVHVRITAFYNSTRIIPNAGVRLQDLIARLPFDQQWRVGVEIWVRAMGLDGAPLRFAQLSPTVQELILRATTLPPP